MKLKDATIVSDEVFGLYRKYGSNNYIGEAVSQIEHMCQAAQLAESQGFDEEVILAAFFHDIGHLCEHILDVKDMAGFGVVDHEYIGANFLRSKGYSEKIARLVESHVQTKRFLTFRYPDYFQSLSPASRETLGFQGGPMDPDEAATFEKDESFPLFIRLREWDDQAKITGMELPDLNRYYKMSVHHLTSQS